MIINVNEIIQEKHDLIRKLDSFKYQNLVDRENDLKRVNDIEIELRELALSNLEDKEKLISKSFVESEKIVNMQDIRKIMNNKYDEMIELRRKTESLLKHFRIKLNRGRELKEQLRGLKPTDKIPNKLKVVVEEIMKW